MADYNKVGLLVLSDNRILFCRKKHTTSRLILPGGCMEAGESPMDCLVREIREELGNVSLSRIEYVGTYADRASTDDPTVFKTLEIQLYKGDLTGEPVPSSEIRELVWFGPDSDRTELTPILVNHILPDLISRGLLAWNSF